MATKGDDPTLKTELGIIQEAFDLINCSYTDQDLQSKQPLVALFKHILFSQYDWQFSKTHVVLTPLVLITRDKIDKKNQFLIPRSIFKILHVYNQIDGSKVTYTLQGDTIVTDVSVTLLSVYCTDMETTRMLSGVPTRFLEALKLKIASHLAITEIADMQLANWCDGLSLKLLEDIKYSDTQRREDSEESETI